MQAHSICMVGSTSYHASEQAPFLPTPTFLRILVNSLSKPDVHLHSAGKRLMERLALRAERVIRPVCLRLCENSMLVAGLSTYPFCWRPHFSESWSTA